MPGTAAGEALLSEMTSLIRLLGEWTRSFPYDFRDDRVMALLRSIAQRYETNKIVSMTKQNIAKSQEKNKQAENLSQPFLN